MLNAILNYAFVIYICEAYEESLIRLNEAGRLANNINLKSPRFTGLYCQLHLFKGMALASMNDFSTAVECFNIAVNCTSKIVLQNEQYLSCHISTLIELGRCYLQLGNVNSADEAYTKAIKLCEDTNREIDYQYIQKGRIVTAYNFLLLKSVKIRDYDSALSYAMALRSGSFRSKEFTTQSIKNLMNELCVLEIRTGKSNTIIYSQYCGDHFIVVGFITSIDFHFESIYITFEYNEDFLHEFWLSLSDKMKDKLLPDQNKNIWLSTDDSPFKTLWYSVRFGEGEWDYLGLHFSLPKLSSLDVLDQKTWDYSSTIRNEKVRTAAIIAPFDTKITNTIFEVVEEVKAVKRDLENIGFNIEVYAVGTEATDCLFEKTLLGGFDLIYFSGHGSINDEGESLYFHRAIIEENEPTISQFGTNELNAIANENYNLFPGTLFFLNACLAGRTKKFGGHSEDLVAQLLFHGASVVVATPDYLFDQVGRLYGESMFTEVNEDTSVSDIVIKARRRVATHYFLDSKQPYYGSWSLLEVHGNAETPVLRNI